MKKLDDMVIYIITDIAVVDQISVDDDLHEIGIDSLKIVEIIIKLEEKFQICFDDSDLDPSKLLTVGDVIRLTERYMEDKK